tara:strand:- start:4443 stop:6560 length:2118 start_codon:yes stop_codon:yes gene_type:complete
MSKESSKLSQKSVHSALKSMKWAALKSHLDTLDFDARIGTKLLGLILRSERVICPHPNPARQHARTVLLTEIEAYARARNFSELAAEYAALNVLIGDIETGYTTLLEQRALLPMAKQKAAERVIGVMRLAAQASIRLSKAANDKLSEDQAFTADVANVELDGVKVNIDAVNTSMVIAATMTLLIEAHQAGWFDVEGIVRLPDCPTPDDTKRDECEPGVISALSWRNWKRNEERVRFLGAQLKSYTFPDMPAWTTQEHRKATEFYPDENGFEVLDHIANKRLERNLLQAFFEMVGETNMADLATGLKPPLEIKPGLLVSAEEGHAGVMLCHALSRPIMLDEREYFGLRIVEWLRGYAVLQEYVREKSTDIEPETLLILAAETDLTSLLRDFGLSDEKANNFLKHLRFRRSSRDLFDHPVIQLTEGNVLLFGPALKHAGLSEVILSTLSNLKVRFDEKGADFEEYILKLLNSQPGVTAKRFKTSRDGTTYEFDVLMRFDEHIFLFECKTHTLSKHIPQNIYYFHKTAIDDAGQVKRLDDALTRHPDILDGLFGEDSSKLPRKVCVLNCFPFSIPGGIDDIGFIDASILTRFFAQRHLHDKALHQHDNAKLIHRVGLMDIWGQNAPTARALLEQIEMPFQVALASEHTEYVSNFFSLSPPHPVAWREIVELPMTAKSVAEFCGVDADSVCDVQDAFSDTLAKARNATD